MAISYKFDKEYHNRYIITGSCAFARNGLIYANAEHLVLQTKIKSLDGLQTIPCTWCYNSDIDWDYKVTPSSTNPNLLLPSKERALIECIKHLDWIDEGFLIEALKDYIDYYYDETALRDAANHFNVTWDTVEYWLTEAKEDVEV